MLPMNQPLIVRRTMISSDLKPSSSNVSKQSLVSYSVKIAGVTWVKVSFD